MRAEALGNRQRSAENLLVAHHISLVLAALERRLRFLHIWALLPASATKAVLSLSHSSLTWPGASGIAITTLAWHQRLYSQNFSAAGRTMKALSAALSWTIAVR